MLFCGRKDGSSRSSPIIVSSSGTLKCATPDRPLCIGPAEFFLHDLFVRHGLYRSGDEHVEVLSTMAIKSVIAECSAAFHGLIALIWDHTGHHRVLEENVRVTTKRSDPTLSRAPPLSFARP